MAASTTRPTPVRLLPPEPTSVRVTLTPSSSHVNRLDGAWWPRTRDLARELTDLVAGLSDSLGQVVHATYSSPDWDGVTRRIHYADGQFKVGSFPSDDSHLLLLSTNTRIFRVLVIPPDLPSPQAHAALLWGSSPGNADSPREILESLVSGEPVPASA